jgi:hypothetical protein
MRKSDWGCEEGTIITLIRNENTNKRQVGETGYKIFVLDKTVSSIPNYIHL